MQKPERFERIVIYISWVLSWASKRFKRSAISREVRHLIEIGSTKNFAEEIPEIVVERGDEDRAFMDLKAGKLVIVLKSGRRDRYENMLGH